MAVLLTTLEEHPKVTALLPFSSELGDLEETLLFSMLSQRLAITHRQQ